MRGDYLLGKKQKFLVKLLSGTSDKNLSFRDIIIKYGVD
jgi:hypothetical protein